MGLWLAALLPSLFLQSLLRQILLGNQPAPGPAGQPTEYALPMLGAFVTAIFVLGAMYWVLRRRAQAALLPDGLALGFGIGLVAQIFTGLSLVGAGFRVMFGDTSTPTLAALAQASYLELLLGLLPLVLFRPALLAVSALQGVLAGRALREGWRYFWLAVLVNTFFVWGILALQLALGGEDPGQVLLGASDPLVAAVTSGYYLLVFALAFRWLLSQVATWGSASVIRNR
jgi:hypothetical protein